MTGMIYFNCISTPSAHVQGSSWVIFPWRQWNCVMPFKQNRILFKQNKTIFLYFLRDKKRFVLKTLSRLKSINVFYLGTSSEDEITELHRLTETSQIPQKPGYPIPQDHHFGITWGAALAGWGSAQETCCQEQQGPFGSVLSDAQPWQPLHIWTQQLLGLPGTACFVSRSWPELAKLILLDCPPLRSLNNHSSRKKKKKKKSMFLTGAARLCPCTLSCRCVRGELLSLKLSGNYFFFPLENKNLQQS